MSKSGAAMSFQDMVLRANKGVLNLEADDLNPKNVSSHVEQDQSYNDCAHEHVVPSCTAEHNSTLEAASSSFW